MQSPARTINLTLSTSPTRLARNSIATLWLMSVVACGAKHTPHAGSSDAGGSLTTSDRSSAHVSNTSSRDDDEPVITAGEDASTPTQPPATTAIPMDAFWCGSSACACNDGLDNDGDGVADGMDQECTGPLDNEEETFATGIPGDNRDPKWQDCFFDGNSGAGDDGCRYHTDCLTGDAPADADECAVTQACIDFCRPLAPPGCDCFGCCEVPFEGATIGIKLSDTCSLANLDDEQACGRCVPTADCSNECGECELCVGKTFADLPAHCGDSTPPVNADGGTTPNAPNGDAGPELDAGPDTPNTTDPGNPDLPPNTCDERVACQSNADCNAGDYCRLGCCIDYTPIVL